MSEKSQQRNTSRDEPENTSTALLNIAVAIAFAATAASFAAPE